MKIGKISKAEIVRRCLRGKQNPLTFAQIESLIGIPADKFNLQKVLGHLVHRNHVERTGDGYKITGLAPSGPAAPPKINRGPPVLSEPGTSMTVNTGLSAPGRGVVLPPVCCLSGIPESKQEASNQIASDVEDFLRRGGKIQRL